MSLIRRIRLVLPLFLALAASSARAGYEADQNAYHLYLKAVLLEGQGNLPAATQAVQQAIVLEPHSGYLHRALAELTVRQGLLKQAEEAVETALALSPEDVKTLVLAGQIYWMNRRIEQAEETLRRAVALDPDAEEAVTYLAAALTPTNPERAVEIYGEYLTRHPGTVPMLEQMAVLQQRLGRRADAKASWGKALEWEPGSARAHLALAQLAEVEADTTTAIAHYDAVLQQDPDNLALLLRAGELRYRANDMATAEQIFARAQSLDPQSPSANFWLALLAEYRGDFKEATRLLEQVSKRAPEPGVLLRLGYYYSAAGRFKDAAAAMDRLVGAEPANSDFIEYAATAHEQAGQYAKAETMLLRLTDLNPRSAEPHFRLGALYDRRRQFDKAEKAFRDAIAIDPECHVAMNYLAYSSAERGVNLDGAESLLNTAISLDPQNAAYLDSMGWVYFKQGRHQKAEDFLKQAVALEKDPVVYSHLGDAQAAQGRHADAIYSWVESLRLQPWSKDVPPRIRKSIQKLDAVERFTVFVRLNGRFYGGIKSVGGVIRIRAKGKGARFEAGAQLAYERDKGIAAEVPGPLAGPVLMVRVPWAGEPEFGAIHPVFQTARTEVLRAFERWQALLSGRVYAALQKASAPHSARISGGRLEGGDAAFRAEFSAVSGAPLRFTWTENGVSDSLVVGPVTEKSDGFPAWFEWSATDGGPVFRFEMTAPQIRYLPRAEEVAPPVALPSPSPTPAPKRKPAGKKK